MASAHGAPCHRMPWYPGNRFGGIMFLGAGLMWLIAGLGGGLVAFVTAIVASLAYIKRRPHERSTKDRS